MRAHDSRLGQAQKAADGSAPARQSEVSDRLATLGLNGLIRLGRPDLARRLLGNRDLSKAATPGAFAHWLRGQTALNAAENGGGDAAHTTALAAFNAAIAASPEPALLADCRFGKAWCLFRLGETEQARDLFRQVAGEFKAQGFSTADVDWMLLLSEWSLADEPPERRLERITAEARSFRQAHPEHPGGGRADELVAQAAPRACVSRRAREERANDIASKLALARKLHAHGANSPPLNGLIHQ